MKPNLSFIVPVKDEEKSIIQLSQEIKTICRQVKKSYEIIFIDDGSRDQSFNVIKKISARNPSIKAVKMRGNFGKSIALQVGFSKAKGKVIFTLDGDLQDNPQEAPKFLKKIDEGFDLVSGWKKTRHDPTFSKVIPSRIVNFLARTLTGLKIHDTNCGFKAYRREVIDSLNLYGELYRFIPILAAKQNFRVGEVEVEHRQRIFGKTKFGWNRGVKGILDLLTVVFLTGYIQRPGHFFGGLGLLSFTAGFTIGLYIGFLRVTTGSIQYRHPLLFLGILLMIIGIQFLSTGLLAEMMIASRGKYDYEKNIIAKIRIS